MSFEIKKDRNPHSINILKLQRYNFDFFSTEEVVLFEYLLVKMISFKRREFYHSNAKIFKETGIRRTRLETIIQRFTILGMLETEIKGFPMVRYYKVKLEGIISQLNSIFIKEENSKLFVEFHKPVVENGKEQNINIEILNSKPANVMDWSTFVETFEPKITGWKKKFKLRKKVDYYYERSMLYAAFEIANSKLIGELENYLSKRVWNQNISTF